VQSRPRVRNLRSGRSGAARIRVNRPEPRQQRRKPVLDESGFEDGDVRAGSPGVDDPVTIRPQPRPAGGASDVQS